MNTSLLDVDPIDPVDRSHWQCKGLVGWWKGLPTLRGNKWFDLSGRGNHGTLANGPTWRLGRVGAALSFDGSDDYVNLGSSAILQPATLSVSAWIKTTTTRSRVAVDKRRSVGSAWALGIYNITAISGSGPGKPQIMAFTATGPAWKGCSSSVAINDGRDHHVLGVIDGANGAIYVDGVLRGSNSDMPAPLEYNGTYNASIARYDYEPTHFPGQLDDVRIYNRALSADEIAAIYQDTLTGRYSPLNRISRYWPVAVAGSSTAPILAEPGVAVLSLGGVLPATRKRITPAAASLSLAGLAPLAGRFVRGPLQVAAGTVYTPGAAAGTVYTPGAAAGTVYTPGAQQGKVT